MAWRRGIEVVLMSQASATPIVFVVDDDVSVRESLELLIRNEGWQAETFQSAQEFHGVVEDAFRGAAVIVDRDRVGVGQARGELDLALEALQVALARAIDAQQLDRRGPAHHAVARGGRRSHSCGTARRRGSVSHGSRHPAAWSEDVSAQRF